jgi:hypothetical protein
MKKVWVFFGMLVVLCMGVLIAQQPAYAETTLKKVKAQTVYVPATFQFWPGQTSATRVVIRNIDPDATITLTSVAFYYNGEEGIVKEFVVSPLGVAPWDSVSYHTKAIDITEVPLYGVDDWNGRRPFFVVKWETQKKALPPIIEGCRFLNAPGGLVASGWDITPGTVLWEKK